MKHLAIRKYFKIILSVFKLSLIRTLSFRTDLVFGILVTLVWQAETLSSIFVLVNKYDSIADWSQKDLLILVLVWRLTNAIVHFLFYFSLNHLPLKISSGSLDCLLTKPVNEIFICSLESFSFNNLIDGLINLTLIIIIIPQFSFANLFSFLFLLIISILVQYLIWLSIVILAFYTNKLNGTFSLFSSIRISGRYPLNSFSSSRILRILTFPFLIISTVPASVLLSKAKNHQLILYTITVVVILLLTIIFWNRSVKKYVSFGG